jgi:hypothetical protein
MKLYLTRSRAELSATSNFHCYLMTAGSNISDGVNAMLRKTVIALLAAVALASPTMALARGGGGEGHGYYAQGYQDYGYGNRYGYGWWPYDYDASAYNPCAYAGDSYGACRSNQ